MASNIRLKAAKKRGSETVKIAAQKQAHRHKMAKMGVILGTGVQSPKYSGDQPRDEQGRWT